MFRVNIYRGEVLSITITITTPFIDKLFGSQGGLVRLYTIFDKIEGIQQFNNTTI